MFNTLRRHRGPGRADQTKIDAIVAPDGKVHISYHASITSIPWTGAHLHWTGDELDELTCALSSGDRPIWRRSKDRASLSVPHVAGRDVVVRVEYSLRPAPLAPGNRDVFVLRGANLPHFRNAAVNAKPGKPDTIVRVRSELGGLRFFGPEYVSFQDDSAAGDRFFAFYEGLTPFELVAGRFCQRQSHGPVFTSSAQTVGIPADLLSKLGRYSESVRDCFRQLLGEASVVHRGILALPSETASCVGSAIILNSNLDSTGIHARRESQLIEVLGHEYAHSWWTYGRLWEDRDTHALLNEMLAVFFARYCVAELGAGSVADPDLELWDYAAFAATRPDVALLRNISASSGFYAAGVLLELARTRRRRVLAMIRNLWRDGETLMLTRQKLYETMTRHLGTLTAGSLMDALEHPRPAIVSARVCSSTAGTWKIRLDASRRTATMLQRRLTALGFPQDTKNSHSITILVPPTEDLTSWLHSLQPLHVMFRRSVAMLRIHSRPLLSRIWQWTNHSPASVVKSVAALVLNRDDPSGWQGLSRVLFPISRTLANKFADAAARRATYAGEDAIRARLPSC